MHTEFLNVHKKKKPETWGILFFSSLSYFHVLLVVKLCFLQFQNLVITKTPEESHFVIPSHGMSTALTKPKHRVRADAFDITINATFLHFHFQSSFFSVARNTMPLTSLGVLLHYWRNFDIVVLNYEHEIPLTIWFSLLCIES